MNDSSALVSVGVASYNNAQYIIETLNSICNQTYQNIELIIVDDFSTDHSVTVVEEWLSANKSRFAGIKFIRNERNKGISHVVNIILGNSNGKYLSMIGSDDIMMDKKIEIQAALLEQSSDDTAVVYSDARLMKKDGSLRYGLFIQMCRHFEDIPEGYIFDDLIDLNFIPAMSTLIKRSVLMAEGMYDENIKFEDWDMWLRLSKKYKFIYSDYASVIYRMHVSSLSHKIDWEIENIKIFEKHLGYSNLAKKKLIEICLKLYYLKRNNDVKSKFSHLQKESKIIHLICKFAEFHVPVFLGKLILKQVLPDNYKKI